MTARVLFVGDIHLGRRPGHLPESLCESEWSETDLGPGAAWRATVDYALGQQVAAVVLAGDVVDCVEDRFEAAARIESGLSALRDAGIQVFAVVGNHDVDALPRMATLVPGFHLLGRDGSWERHKVETTDGSPLYLLGWSFTNQKEYSNPIAKLSQSDFDTDEGVTLGVLHCDLGASGGPYAPVPRRDLEEGPAANADGWLLGHVHKPSDLEGPRPVGYLGSLTGLDPGEPGRHGPWLVTVGSAGAIDIEQIPLAPMRWERIDVSVAGIDVDSGVQAADELYRLLSGALADLCASLQVEATHLRAVGVRVTVQGSSATAAHWHAAIDAAMGDAERRPSRNLEGCFYFVEKLLDRVRPAHDLGELARGNDPVGLLARRLQALELLDDDGLELVRAADKRFEQLSVSGLWVDLDYQDRERPDTRALLLRAGYTSLERLLEQGPEGAEETRP